VCGTHLGQSPPPGSGFSALLLSVLFLCECAFKPLHTSVNVVLLLT
jgi:hypothetical protein